MRHAHRRWWAAALACIATASLSGCAGDGQTVETFRSADGNVINGEAYDQAVAALDGVRTAILPEDARVESNAMDGNAHIYMRKVLGYMGHPGTSVTIYATRKELGVAAQRTGDTLRLVPVGEWDSRIEGGARVEMVVVLPPSVRVERQAGMRHAMGEPAGVPWGFRSATQPMAEGWKRIPDEPDPEYAQRWK